MPICRLLAIVSVCLFILQSPACSSARPGAPSAGPGVAASPVAQSSAGPLAHHTVDSVEDWTFNGSPGRIIRTANYRIFTTQPETVLSARVPGFVEAALERYRTALSTPGTSLPEPELKLDTFLMRSRPDWVVLTKSLTGDQADLFLRIPRGGFAFGGKALMFDIGPRDTLAVLGHEGWHQYTQRTFRHPLPIWLEEGLGTYMEGHRWEGPSGTDVRFLPWCNVERFDQLRTVEAQGRLMGLMDLLESTPAELLAVRDDRALTFYAQVWSLTHFLAEGAGGRYRPALGELLADAAAGTVTRRVAQAFGPQRAGAIVAQRRGPAVFMAYFNPDLEEAGREYDAFLRRLVQPGSRGPIVAGESPMKAVAD